MSINVALLLRVADVISKHPEQFKMAVFDCGTAACIAGWAVRLSAVEAPGSLDVPRVARQLLEQNEQPNWSLWSELFHARLWTAQFRFLPQDNPADRAAKAVARIHAFLDEHAPEWRIDHAALDRIAVPGAEERAP